MHVDIMRRYCPLKRTMSYMTGDVFRVKSYEDIRESKQQTQNKTYTSQVVHQCTASNYAL